MSWDGTSFPDIIDAVSDVARVSKRALFGRVRDRRVAYPRQLIMFLACQRCGWMMPDQIGYYLNRDRSTVTHGRDAARRRIERDESYREFYNAVVARLDGQREAAE